MVHMCSRNNHNICLGKANEIINIVDNQGIMTRHTFISFLDYLKNYSYSTNCLIQELNPHFNSLMNSIKKATTIFTMDPEHYITLLKYVKSEAVLKEILNNILKHDNYYVDKISCVYVTGNNILITYLMLNRMVEIKDIMLEYLTMEGFINMCRRVYTSYNSYLFCDTFVVEYIKKYNDLFTENNITKLLDMFTNRVALLKDVYFYFSSKLNSKKIKELLDKEITTVDKELVLNILTNNPEVKPDFTTVKSLLIRSQCADSDGAYNKKNVAVIMDILIAHGLKITKQIILTMLDHGCYINNVQQHDIEIDEEIVIKCIQKNFYPYEYSFIPTDKCVLEECNKNNNLENIKKLKEKGANFNSSHLARACSIRKNGKVLKFLVNECNVKPDDDCLKLFQETYNIDGLDILISKFKNNSGEVKTDNKKHSENDYLKINDECVLKLDKNNIEVYEDKEYLLKNKIKKLLNYKFKKVTIYDLHKMLLQYFIDNQLVIGNYIVINNILSTITKLPSNALLCVDELYNMCTFMIDEIKE